MLDLRKTFVDDDPFLSEVYASTRIDEMSTWGWEIHDKSAFLSMQWMIQKKAYQSQFPNAENLIIMYDGIRVGRMMLQKTQEKIQLIDISLLPQSRNKGIGSSLITNLQQESLLKNLTIELHVTPLNPAKRLYERLGFYLHETSDFYWKMVWHPKKLTV